MRMHRSESNLVLPFDIRAEAFCARLLEIKGAEGAKPQVKVRPLGRRKNGDGREIEAVSTLEYNHEGKELIRMDINRDGLYDTLPESLFMVEIDPLEEGVEKAKRWGNQKEMSKRFFLPFEQELYHTRIQIEQTESQTIQELSKWLIYIYGLDTSEYQDQMKSFAQYLPCIDQIVGNTSRTKWVLEQTIGKKIDLHYEKGESHPVPNEWKAEMGACSIGAEMVLGDSFSDGMDLLSISILDVEAEEIEHWIPNGRKRRWLENDLLPHLLPAESDFRIHICMQISPSSPILGGNEKSSRMGFITLIE
jgi:hypothetical protein